MQALRVLTPAPLNVQLIMQRIVALPLHSMTLQLTTIARELARNAIVILVRRLSTKRLSDFRRGAKLIDRAYSL